MIKLSVEEKYRVETKEEAEAFIKEERESGGREGYIVSKAGYVHKQKKAKGEIIDKCEVVSITKVFADVWMMDNEGQE